MLKQKDNLRRNMVQAIKNLFKSDEKQTEQIKLQVGTYKIIKGVILND